MLVHCYAGVSRSATLLLAYMIASERMTPKQALARLKEARPAAQPNFGFMRQLEAYAHSLGILPSGPTLNPSTRHVDCTDALVIHKATIQPRDSPASTTTASAAPTPSHVPPSSTQHPYVPCTNASLYSQFIGRSNLSKTTVARRSEELYNNAVLIDPDAPESPPGLAPLHEPETSTPAVAQLPASLLSLSLSKEL